MKFWRDITLLFAIAVTIAVAGECARRRVDGRQVAQLLLTEQEVSKWKALYAEAATSVERRVDTVRRYAIRYKAIRDSVLITDTVRLTDGDSQIVNRLIVQSDSLVSACTELANDCERLRLRADSLLDSERILGRHWLKMYEADHARRVRAERYWIAGVLGGALLGAWVRGR